MFEILLSANITESPYPSAPHRVYCPARRFHLLCLLAEGHAHSMEGSVGCRHLMCSLLVARQQSRGKPKDKDSIAFSPSTGKTLHACLNTMGLLHILRVYSPLGNANDVLITFTFNTSKETVSQFSFFYIVFIFMCMSGLPTTLVPHACSTNRGQKGASDPWG